MLEAPNVGLLGCQANTLDTKNQVEYMNMPVNVSGKINIDIVAVNLKDGKVTKFLQFNPTAGQIITSMDYDAKTHAIYGFGPSETERVRLLGADFDGFSFDEKGFKAWERFLKAVAKHTLAKLDLATKKVTV